MKRNKKKVHRGKPVYTFQGVDYLARRDTSRCLGVCRKHKKKTVDKIWAPKVIHFHFTISKIAPVYLF